MTSFSSNTPNGADAWGARNGGSRGCCTGGFAWRPLELVAMILGFIVFWPVGLAVIGLKLWQRRCGYSGDVFSFAHERAEDIRNTCRNWKQGRWTTPGNAGRNDSATPFRMNSTGNSAFDEWRAGELARLEEERRKLEQAEREFAAHIEELRRARDREEFERFMATRRGNSA